MVAMYATQTQATQKEMKLFSGKRKHYSQMSIQEINGLFKRLRQVRSNQWHLSGHVFDRLEGKGINATRADIISCIHNSTLIEYKIDERFNVCDERVLLRANAIVNDCYNLHVVYSLTNKRVITVWINHIRDHHKTLDWSLYTADMKVFGV
jgi:hypothetical protein